MSTGREFIKRKVEKRAARSIARLDTLASGSSLGSWFVGEVSQDKQYITKPDGTRLNLEFTGQVQEFALACQITPDTAYAPASPALRQPAIDGSKEKGFLAITQSSISFPTFRKTGAYVKEIGKDPVYVVNRNDFNFSSPLVSNQRILKFTPDGKDIVDILIVYTTVPKSIILATFPTPTTINYSDDEMQFKVRFIKNYSLNSETLEVDGTVTSIDSPIIKRTNLTNAPAPSAVPGSFGQFTDGFAATFGTVTTPSLFSNAQNFYAYKYTDGFGDIQIGLDHIGSFGSYAQNYGFSSPNFVSNTSWYIGFYQILGMTSAGDLGTLSLSDDSDFLSPQGPTNQTSAASVNRFIAFATPGSTGGRGARSTAVYNKSDLTGNTGFRNVTGSTGTQPFGSPYFNLQSAVAFSGSVPTGGEYQTCSNLYAFKPLDFSTFNALSFSSRFRARATDSSKFLTHHVTSQASGNNISKISRFNISESLPVFAKEFSGNYPITITDATLTSPLANCVVQDFILKRS